MTIADKPTSQLGVLKNRLGITWSPEQEAIIMCTAREVLGGGGERAGKSRVAADYLNVRRAWSDGGLYWIAGKDYDRCHAEFEYVAQAMLKLQAVKPEDIHTPQSGQWHMQLITGTVIKTWSLQDWLKVGSEAPDGIIIAEVAQVTHAEYLRLTDRTAERRGWVIGTGTFEGSLGWYPELWKLYQLPGQGGQSFSLPSWSNRFIYPGGYDDPEIQRLREKYADRPDYFQERFGGVPSPPKGLVFPEFRALTHVKELVMDDSPVYLYVDPGYAGAYAVEVIQIQGETVRVVEEIYEQGLVTEQIVDMCMMRPWWKQVTAGVVDIAARQHQAMPAVVEVWAEKAKLHLTSKRVEEAEGRERLHTFLTVNPIDHEPRLFIDPKCQGILSEFGVCANPFTGEAAPYKWKEARTGEVVGQHPEDKNNHGVKALTYGLVDRFGFVNRNMENRYKPSLSVRRR
jgi:hypothetical protein